VCLNSKHTVTAQNRLKSWKHAPRLASLSIRGGAIMYAIIETGGKQYKVEKGTELYIEKLHVAEGETVNFDKVVFVSKDGEVLTGAPTVAGATVSAKVERHGKGAKLTIFKYKSKKNYRRKQGHRQPYTKVVVEAINA